MVLLWLPVSHRWWLIIGEDGGGWLVGIDRRSCVLSLGLARYIPDIRHRHGEHTTTKQLTSLVIRLFL